MAEIEPQARFRLPPLVRDLVDIDTLRQRLLQREQAVIIPKDAELTDDEDEFGLGPLFAALRAAMPPHEEPVSDLERLSDWSMFEYLGYALDQSLQPRRNGEKVFVPDATVVFSEIIFGLYGDTTSKVPEEQLTEELRHAADYLTHNIGLDLHFMIAAATMYRYMMPKFGEPNAQFIEQFITSYLQELPQFAHHSFEAGVAHMTGETVSSPEDNSMEGEIFEDEVGILADRIGIKDEDFSTFCWFNLRNAHHTLVGELLRYEPRGHKFLDQQGIPYDEDTMHKMQQRLRDFSHALRYKLDGDEIGSFYLDRSVHVPFWIDPIVRTPLVNTDNLNPIYTTSSSNPGISKLLLEIQEMYDAWQGMRQTYMEPDRDMKFLLGHRRIR